MPSIRTHALDFKKIKERVSIPELLEAFGWMQFMTSNPDGSLKGPCPIHNKHQPEEATSQSFKVTENGRGFICFGCNQKGSVLDLLHAERNTGSIRVAAQLLQSWFPEASEEEHSSDPLPEMVLKHRGMIEQCLRGYADQEGLIGFYFDRDERFVGTAIFAGRRELLGERTRLKARTLHHDSKRAHRGFTSVVALNTRTGRLDQYMIKAVETIQSTGHDDVIWCDAVGIAPFEE